MARKLVVPFSLGLIAFLFVGLGFAEPPAAARKVVTDEYHGVKVSDPYRWLEDAKDPAVRQWILDQNEHSRAFLNKLTSRRPISNRLKLLYDSKTFHYSKMTYHKGKVYSLSGGAVVLIKDINDAESEVLLVDPEEITGNKKSDLDFYVLSPDGGKVAVSISQDGRQDGTVYVVDLKTGKPMEDKIIHVCSAMGGSLAWKGDSSGFYYTRNDKCTLRPVHVPGGQEQIYFHKLGDDPVNDTYVLGKEFSPISGTVLDISQDGQWLIASSTSGWTSDTAVHHLLSPKGKWHTLNKPEDRVMALSFGPDGKLWILSHKDAPRGKILRHDPETPDLKKAELILPQGEGVMQGLTITKNKLVLTDRLNGSARLRIFDHQGKEERAIKLPPLSHIEEVLAMKDDEVLYHQETYLTPPVWTRLDTATGQSYPTALDSKFPNVDFSDTEVVRKYAKSKDGAKVPLTILQRKDTKLDGHNPVLLEGYGGYGNNLTPEFSPSHRLWIEQGGIWVLAHLRGDGEFGEDWHEAALVTNKQKSFDDFIACARFLIDEKYTKPERLGIEGGSNGGTLVGVALVQEPTLFRAVVAQSGNFDTIRQEFHPAGRFDIPEFGSVKVKEQFDSLYSYSPYHQAKGGVAYPGVLVVCGENDPRVDPSDSRKFTAQLQQATSSKNPVLLTTRLNSGHSCVSFEEEMSTQADTFSFLFDQLGVTYKPIKKARP